MGAACSIAAVSNVIVQSRPAAIVSEQPSHSPAALASVEVQGTPVVVSAAAAVPDDDPDLEQLKQKNRCDSCILRCGVLAQKGDYEGAVAELQEALKHFPNSARAHLELGACQHKLGRLDDAASSFTRALELQKELFIAHINRARVFIDQERYIDAIADCKAASIIDSDNPDSYAVKLLAEEKLESAEGIDMLGDVFNSPAGPREKKICIICMDDERGSRLHPCLHAALCFQCAEDLKERGFKCPICNSAIQEVEAGLFMDTYSYGDNALQKELLEVAAEVRARMSPMSGASPTSVVFSPSGSINWSRSASRMPDALPSPAPSPVPAAAIHEPSDGTRGEEQLQQQPRTEPDEDADAALATERSDPAESSILDGDLTIDIEGIPDVPPPLNRPPAIGPQYSQLTVQVT